MRSTGALDISHDSQHQKPYYGITTRETNTNNNNF